MSIGQAVAAILVALALVAAPARAHDQAFTAEENAWLNRQRAVDGTKCCDERDARVGQLVDWRLRGGTYEVLIQGAWRQVPAGRLMRHNPADPSPWPGQALLFWSPAVNARDGFHLWCFYPEPLT